MFGSAGGSLKVTARSLIDDEDGWVQRFLDVTAGDASAELRTSLELTIRIGHLLSRIQSERPMVKSEISALDFDMLAAITAQGPPYQARPSDLATSAGVTKGTMTTRIDRLERLGLVKRAIDEEDRRIRWICLTRKGLDRLRSQTWHIVETRFFAAIGSLSEPERRALTATLTKLSRI